MSNNDTGHVRSVQMTSACHVPSIGIEIDVPTVPIHVSIDQHAADSMPVHAQSMLHSHTGPFHTHAASCMIDTSIKDGHVMSIESMESSVTPVTSSSTPLLPSTDAPTPPSHMQTCAIDVIPTPGSYMDMPVHMGGSLEHELIHVGSVPTRTRSSARVAARVLSVCDAYD